MSVTSDPCAFSGTRILPYPQSLLTCCFIASTVVNVGPAQQHCTCNSYTLLCAGHSLHMQDEKSVHVIIGSCMCCLHGQQGNDMHGWCQTDPLPPYW